MNGAELLVSAMEKEDVQQIFGVPGEENLDLVEALRRSTIKLVVDPGSTSAPPRSRSGTICIGQ